MKAAESSLSYRSIQAAFRWAGRYAARSLTARALARLSWAALPALGDSRSFGTSRVRSVPMQRWVVAEAPGRELRGLAAAAPTSGFADGDWLRVAGAALAGLGCGLLSSRLVEAVAMIIVGLLLVVAGPSVLAAARAGAVAGLFGARPPARAGRPAGALAGGLSRARRVAWAAMLLAAAAGALAGVGPATRAVLALVFVIAAAAALLWRPQFVLLVVVAFPWMDWAARHTLGGLGPLWDDALLLVSVALILWSALVLGRGAPRSVLVTVPVLLMLAAAVGSIVVNHVPGDVGFYGLRVLFEPILFYFVGFLIPKDRRWVRWTVGVFLVTSTLLALHGLYQYATHAPVPANWVDVTETSIGTRAYSVVQNPNVLGAILAMGALISGSLALPRAFAGVRRIALVAACVVQLGGLAVTFSRGAWIGFVIGLLAMIVLAYRRYIVGVAAAGVVAWFAAPQVFIQRLLFSFSGAYAAKSSTGLGRLYRWEASLQHIVDKPLLGVGLGTFGGTSAYLFGYWGLWVDNFYLQMGAEGGLLLLVFFLWLLLRSAKGLVRGYRIAGDPYLKALAAGMLGAFIAVVAADFFEGDWETLAVGVEFWFLAGLVTSALLEQPKPAAGAGGVPANDVPAGKEAAR